MRLAEAGKKRRKPRPRWPSPGRRISRFMSGRAPPARAVTAELEAPQQHDGGGRDEQLLEEARVEAGQRPRRPAARDAGPVAHERQTARRVQARRHREARPRPRPRGAQRQARRQPACRGPRSPPWPRSRGAPGRPRRRAATAPTARISDTRPPAAHAGKAERLVELHDADQDARPGGEADEHRLRQEAQEVRRRRRARRRRGSAPASRVSVASTGRPSAPSRPFGAR